MAVLFQTGKVAVRELHYEDRYLLAKWLSDPLVLKFYEGRDSPFDVEKVSEKFFTPEEGLNRCIAEFEKEALAYIQFYRVDEKQKKEFGYKDANVYGMDQFIGETTYWNRGIGTLLVSAMTAYLVKEKQAEVVIMDPQEWNERALRCYGKCGFEKVRLLPDHELHEGEYRDCWLIEYRK